MTDKRDILERVIFLTRWLLAPIYLGLGVALTAFVVKFAISLCEFLWVFLSLSSADVLLKILHLIDCAMVGNLIVMVVIGGFALFIRRLEPKGDREQLQWLEHLDPGALKLKLGMSLIGVSSIQLLEAFVDAQHMTNEQLFRLLAIHLIFVLSTVAIAWVNHLHRHKADLSAES